MKLLFKDSFLQRLESQIEYISSDSPKRARKFKNDLLNRIREIPVNPYRYRKSIYFEQKEIRELIFKGYTVVFRISKHQKDPTD